MSLPHRFIYKKFNLDYVLELLYEGFNCKKYRYFYAKQDMHSIDDENKNFEILNFEP